MVLKKMKKIIFVLIFLSTTLPFFAVPADSAVRFLEKANESYKQGDVDNAYKYVNQAFVFSQNSEKKGSADLRQSVLYFAQLIYIEKLILIFNNYDELELLEVEANLERYPKLSNSKIKKIINQIKLKQENPESQGELAEYESSILDFGEDMSLAAESKLEYDINPENDNKEIQEDFIEKNKLPELSTGVIIFSIISLSIIGAVIIVLIIIVCKKGITHQQLQQKKYIKIFNVNNDESDNSSNNKDESEKSISPIVNDVIQGQNVIKDQTIIQGQAELKEFVEKCELLGNKIDRVTGRKNNSKNVSEIVYKLSLELGITPFMAIMNYCASLIYDAGFLGIDQDLLNSISLNEEEKEAMKTHVSIAKKYLKFVPKEYYALFEDAATKHHENMDGSGYPRGLSGGEIPQIARLIRVAESFISISSKRLYRAPIDKEAAVAKLKEKPEFYDPDVVKVLEKIV